MKSRTALLKVAKPITNNPILTTILRSVHSEEEALTKVTNYAEKESKLCIDELKVAAIAFQDLRKFHPKQFQILTKNLSVNLQRMNSNRKKGKKFINSRVQVIAGHA
ncbi:hypothetical protein ISS03_04900 [Patescibacteria group bacterium]|nr:hypothetical protein [Patescibacteria group bacterium]